MSQWIESRLDDAVFESALLPLLGQSLEKIFCGKGVTAEEGKSLCGIFVLHKELGLILQNDDSRRIYPKTFPGLSAEALLGLVSAALPPASRPAFSALSGETGTAVSGGFPLLPDRISEARSLFFWEIRFDWGRIVVLKTGGKEEMEVFEPPFRKEVEAPGSFLRKILDAWMFDTTMEVFWGRILAHMPSAFLPKEEGPSPEWRRRISIPFEGASGEGKCLVAQYFRDFENGWRRVLRYEKKGSGPVRPQTFRAGPASGSGLDIPVGFWGVLPLGGVLFPAHLVRKVNVPHFLGRLRWARTMALRTLYRHLLYPGSLDLLSYWVPENETFDPALIGHLPAFLGEGVLDDTLLSLRLSSPGYRKIVEEKIRPDDFLFSESRHAGRLIALLRSCPPHVATECVLPRIASLEGAEANSFATSTLRDHLKGQPSPEYLPPASVATAS